MDDTVIMGQKVYHYRKEVIDFGADTPPVYSKNIKDDNNNTDFGGERTD